MAFLHEHRYQTLGLTEAAARIYGTGALGSNAIVITFDDGFRDFYTRAFPVLQQYGHTATVFLPTGYIGGTSQRFNSTECMTWREVRELQKIGIEFGSHTVTHPQLRTLKRTDIEKEVQCSGETLRQELGCQVTSFSYPYAFPETDREFTATLRHMLEDAGYNVGVSTAIGTADRTGDVLFMKRLPMNSWDDRRLFRAKLQGAYNWLHSVQYASKLLRKQTTK